MAFIRVFVLLVATVLLAEGRIINKRATFDLGQYLGSASQTTEAAQKTILAGSAEIVSVTDNAKALLTGFLETAKNAQAKVEAQAKTEIDSIVTNAKAKASTQSGDQACVTKVIGDVEALAATTLLNIANCALDKVTAIENLLIKAVSTADTAITAAPNAILGIEDCKKQGIFENPCKAVVVFKFVVQVNSVVADTTKIVASATSMYASLTTDLTTCATTKIAQLTPEVAKIVAGFAICQVKAKLLG